MKQVTVGELKQFIASLSSTNEHGEDYEVWIGNGKVSNPCVDISLLNKGDILLEMRNKDKDLFKW